MSPGSIGMGVIVGLWASRLRIVAGFRVGSSAFTMYLGCTLRPFK